LGVAYTGDTIAASYLKADWL